MRILVGILAVMMGCTGAFAAKEKSELDLVVEALKKHVRLGLVNFMTERDKTTREKTEIITTETYQDRTSPFIGTLRFTFEFTDKEKNVYFGQAIIPKKKQMSDYGGQDDWRLRIPHGNLEYPKLTAYVMEFGFETNGTFVVVDQKTKKAENSDEILARNKDPEKKIKCTGILVKEYSRRDKDN
ncbi:MAG: hypothetical protein MUC65_06445 [Pontiellaceae bacterium]|nr:hypothetical protein [Pontiellaceae bacterium]